MNPLIAVAGAWIAFDGIASIIKYWKQSSFEHFIRLLRTGIGIAFILYGIL